MLDTFQQIFVLFFVAAISENIVLSKFLGICPFMGVSKKLSSAYQMGLAVTFVMLFSSLVTWAINKFVLLPFDLEFLKIVSFILVIASSVQFLEMYLQKYFEGVYDAFGIYLPLITTNCAILGVALLNIQYNHGLFESIFYPIGSGIGFLIALILMAGIREKLELADLPRAFKGAPVALIVAGLLALAFTGLKTIIFT